MTDRLDLLRRSCPAAFYVPNKPAAEEYIVANGGLPGTKSQGDRPWFESDAKIRISVGGNRAGKTTKLILESGAAAVGFRPWYPPSSRWYTSGLPEGDAISIRYTVPNFGVHLPEVVRELEKWWSRDWWSVSGRDDRGVPREITWFTGAKTHFMSHHMDPEDFEGVESDLNVWDEPPPKDLFSRLERGLVSTGGRSIVGCTLLDASGWFWDEIVVPGESMDEKDVKVTWHSIWDNTAENGGCPKQTAENVRLWLEFKVTDPDERLAREHGSPMHIGGLVLSGWNAGTVVDPFELPATAWIISAIDPAGSKPFAGLHAALIPTPDGKLEGHFFDETWIPQSSRDLGLFAEVWNSKEDGKSEIRHPSRSVVTLIDPFAGETQKADTYARSMTQILFEEYGIATVNADRSGKRARLLQLNTNHRTGKWRWWSNCRRALMERKRWSWDQKSPKLTKGPDDVMDAAAYIDGADPWAMFGHTDEEVSGVWIPPEYRERDRLRMKSRLREAARDRIREARGQDKKWHRDERY